MKTTFFMPAPLLVLCPDHAPVAPADQTAAPIASAVSASPAVVTADTGVHGFGSNGDIVIRYFERLRLIRTRPVCPEGNPPIFNELHL